MSVVAFGTVRSAGATTTLAAVAASWPTGPTVLMVEADPAGGTLAACWGLPAEPGLVSLAAATRRRVDPELVWEHTQPAGRDGQMLLAGPVAAEQARAALGMAGGLLAQLRRLDADVLLDCGRLDPASPTLALFGAADAAVLVVRPQLADLHHLADWLARHRPDHPRLGVVLVGPAAFAATDIATTLRIEVWGELPHDPAGVSGLTVDPARWGARSPLARHARSLADTLTARLALAGAHPAGADRAGVPVDDRAPLDARPQGEPVDVADRAGSASHQIEAVR